MTMNLNNGSSQILAPVSNRAAPSMRNPDSLSLSDAHAPAQSERERASPVGENGTEMLHAAVSEFIRPTALDTLDRDLWAAGQSITASRRERMAIYRALDDATAARASLERSAAASWKKYDRAKLEYHQLFGHYKTLYEQHESLKKRHDHVCGNLTKAIEDQRRLQATSITLEDDRALKEALELELQQSKDELATLEDWKCQELQSRDNTIDKLQGDIQMKDAQLSHFAEKLESLEQQQNQIFMESIEDCEIKDAEISRLQTESATHGQALDQQRDQVVALSSELESAQLFIQALQKLQNEMEETHSQALQHLQYENDNLKESLEVTRSNGQIETNDQVVSTQAETELELLRNDHTSLMQQLETVKKTLLARFSGLHDNLDNLSSVLGENGEQKKGKKRKVTK
ncbi:hypothetical protein B0T10DRAFT_564910 [Thelonectria olida]|uniref:Uncharacterized protein n=1 Tax=Thelonectria olida TaxID=1576542 RepID=A0A9P8VY79_9HYPO|nr:hypothetical protein B0T10DRAFT_564910 [Thelonectria olida]